MTCPRIPPAPKPEPKLAQAVMWARCYLFLARRDLGRRVQTLVSGDRDRAVVRADRPSRSHPDHLCSDGLTSAQLAELALLDTETVAELPVGLRIALTCGLTSKLTRLTSRGSGS